MQIPFASKSDKTKTQQEFFKRCQRIEVLEKKNRNLKNRLEGIRLLVTEQLFPITLKICAARLESIKILDQQHAKDNFRKNEKRKISQLIIEGSEILMREFGDDSAISYLRKHANIVSNANNENEFIEDIFSDGFYDKNTEPDFHSSKKRNDTKKSSTTKSATEQTNIESKTKSLYYELANKLHPDRESDDDKKIEKTNLFIEVNDAYRNGDLYNLIKLKALHLNATLSESDDELNLYNKELNQKIRVFR